MTATVTGLRGAAGCAPRAGALALFALAICGPLRAQTAAPAATPRPQSLPPVQARLLIRDAAKDTLSNREVTLLGRTPDALLAQSVQGGGEPFRVEMARVTRCDFVLDYDRTALANALRDNDWAAAVRTLSPVLRPTFPYLDIIENNAFDLALDLGMYMVSSADREMRAATDDAGRERALKQYEAAYEVFRYIGRADWNPLSQVAILKGCRALIAQGKNEAAAGNLKRVEPPEPGDATYGHYWLVQAELLQRAGKTLEALEAAVQSVVFADKDVETFPTALLLSADCHAALGEHHRARDIYYEVAVLFTGTDWAADARAGLQAILDGNKTLEAEKAPLENVFFNVTEDMNKLAEELLRKTEATAPRTGAAGGEGNP